MSIPKLRICLYSASKMPLTILVADPKAVRLRVRGYEDSTKRGAPHGFFKSPPWHKTLGSVTAGNTILQASRGEVEHLAIQLPFSFRFTRASRPN